MAIVVSLPAIVIRRSALDTGRDAAKLLCAAPQDSVSSDECLVAIAAESEDALRSAFSELFLLGPESVCLLAGERQVDPEWLCVSACKDQRVTVRLRGYYPLPSELLVFPVLPV